MDDTLQYNDVQRLTVSDMLKLQELPAMTLVAGEQGLHNIIKTVSVYEVPDAYKWFRGHEVIITTFISVPPQDYPLVMQELATRHIAAIILCYPELYYGAVPQELLRLSNEYRIPMLTVTKEVAYTEIMGPIIRKLLGEDTDLLNFQVKIMNEYNWLLLNGALFNDLLSFIYHFFARPVLLLDVDYDPVAYKTINEDESIQINTFVKRQLPRLVARDTLSFEKGERNLVSHEGTPVMVYPIVSNGTFLGALALFGMGNLNREANIVVEYGLQALATLFINRYADARNRDNLKYELIRLLEQETPDKESSRLIVEKLRILGLNPETPLRVVVLLIPEQSATAKPFSDKAKRKHIQTCMNLYCANALLLEHRDQYILLMPSPSDAAFTASLQNFLEKLEIHLGEVRCAVSAPTLDMEVLPAGYHLAAAALHIGAIDFLSPSRIIWTQQVEPLIYLQQSIGQTDGHRLLEWAERVLAPLINYDNKKGSNLLQTLGMLLFENENLQKIADELFIHKNTLVYRKTLIEQLLGKSLTKNHFYYALAIIVLSLHRKPE